METVTSFDKDNCKMYLV